MSVIGCICKALTIPYGPYATKTNRARNRIAEWMRENKLTLAPQKSEAVLLVGKKRCRNPRIHLENQPIAIVDKAKYLGIIIDRKINFSQHINYATTRAHKAATNLARILPRTTRVRGSKRRILATVAGSIALYGAAIWAQIALKVKTNRRKLESAQRPIAIRVARAHRTTSTEALQVLAKLIPWTLMAEERRRIYDSDIGLEEQITAKQAREQTINKWQEKWEDPTNTKATWTKKLIPDLNQWLNTTHADTNYFTSQILTGHGKFQTYLKRIGKSNTSTCPCCTNNEEDDVIHTLYKCTAWAGQRKTLTLKEGEEGTQALKQRIAQMLMTEKNWINTSREIEDILREKTNKERERQQSQQQARNEESRIPLTTTSEQNTDAIT